MTHGWREMQHRFGGNTTEALIRWVIAWDRILDQDILHGADWWRVADAKGAAITELLRRGVSSIRWGYAPPWGRRVPV